MYDFLLGSSLYQRLPAPPLKVGSKLNPPEKTKEFPYINTFAKIGA
jgi:hypothetical protein